jgi:hypothetical protein
MDEAAVTVSLEPVGESWWVLPCFRVWVLGLTSGAPCLTFFCFLFCAMVVVNQVSSKSLRKAEVAGSLGSGKVA